ncbi:MAG: AzlD domain-containing protein [Candidatus Limnocylindrales bacterium]|jgi:branched-subunit amino acid transport protein
MNLGTALVPLAFVMWAVTYPSRALPMLAPGIERLPKWAVTYLRLAGPAALAALAATGSLLTTDTPPHLQLGVMPLAVALCVIVVWRTRLLLAGVVAAVVLVALARALGLA